MIEFNYEIVPSATQKKLADESRYLRDKNCYNQGKEDASMQLNREYGVSYSKRDKEYYDMGYSYGETL